MLRLVKCLAQLTVFAVVEWNNKSVTSFTLHFGCRSTNLCRQVPPVAKFYRFLHGMKCDRTMRVAFLTFSICGFPVFITYTVVRTPHHAGNAVFGLPTVRAMGPVLTTRRTASKGTTSQSLPSATQYTIVHALSKCP